LSPCVPQCTSEAFRCIGAPYKFLMSGQRPHPLYARVLRLATCAARAFGLTLSMARGGCERRAYMVTRISKTGAIYYDYPPFDQAELEEGHPSEVKEGAAAKAIALERVEAGRHAFIAPGEGGQLVGWCIKRDDGWYIQGR